MGNVVSKPEKSEHENKDNAIDNYNHFLKFQKNIKPGISFKVHDGYYNSEVDRDGEHHNVWKVKEPARYVVFSWKNKKGLNCAHPLSFHINRGKFEEELSPFVDTQPRIYMPGGD